MKEFLVGIFLLLTAHLSSASDAVEHKIGNMAITTPSGFLVKASSPVEDFEIYSIQKNGRPYVSVYIGNQPGFPKKIASGHELQTRLYSDGLQVISIWRAGKLIKRELLIRLSQKKWPNYLHAWIVDDLTSGEIEIADMILMSIDARGSISDQNPDKRQ
ncbi:MAG: hypothetical protein FWD62_01965 [Betaproteobacteria bacterium]|nr:hypothetical protein [Betaproteobacteria bacterium]